MIPKLFGGTQESGVDRAGRLCKAGYASWCREYDRLTAGTAPEQFRALSPEQMAAERERHYAERSGGITRGLTNVSQAGFIDPRIAEASRTGQDVEYDDSDRVVRVIPADSSWDWGAIGGFFTGILGAAAPVAGGLYTQRTQADYQQDMLKLAMQSGRPGQSSPQTIVIPGSKSNNTGLYIGLGVAALAVVIVIIVLIRR